MEKEVLDTLHAISHWPPIEELRTSLKGSCQLYSGHVQRSLYRLDQEIATPQILLFVKGAWLLASCPGMRLAADERCYRGSRVADQASGH